MLSRRTILLAAILLAVAGCRGSDETLTIPPLPAAEGRVNPGLGPDTRPLSMGPGDKGSPSWGAGGEQIAYIVDGYVVDRPVDGGAVRPRTTRDFVVQEAEWTGEALTVLGAAGGDSSSLYRASSGEGSLGVEKIAARVLAFSPGPGEERSIAALRTGPRESGLALLRGEEVEQVYADAVGGTVTGLSPSPDGRKVALAVRTAEDRQTSELRVFDLQDGSQQRITRLAAGVEVLGVPQWTRRGIYFVAGSSEGSGEPLYDLLRAGPEPGEPEPAPGVGEGFVAGGARVSPDGERLAVVGRLNPKSPADLYILDLDSESFSAVTTNEDMDIKTGPDDLAWSPSGTSVALVARGASTGEPEVRAAPAEDLLDDFYNLYEVPIDGSSVPAEKPGAHR